MRDLLLILGLVVGLPAYLAGLAGLVYTVGYGLTHDAHAPEHWIVLASVAGASVGWVLCKAATEEGL
jgi:hypothetical protein